jgi:hypothetical protein
MTNTQRNTTIISIILALVLCTGYYFTHRLTKQDDLLKGKNLTLKTEIAKLDSMLAMREQIEYDYEVLQVMIAQQTKILAQNDTPAITYNYLLQLLKWMKRNINFDFSLSGKKAPDASWNEYIVSGTSNFIDVTNFIKQLEFQRPLLTVDELTIADNAKGVSDTVQFSLVFKTHFSPNGTPVENVQEKNVPRYATSFVSFRPRIYDTPPETDIDPSLVQVDKALIVGITPTRAFLRDDRGIIHILSIGDRVAYGYLYSIDVKQDKLVFRLNQYGSSEDKTLFMQKAPGN